MTRLPPSPPAEALLTAQQRAAGYRLVAEVLLYPEDRDAAAITAYREALGDARLEVAALDAALASPRTADAAEYLALLELAPPCPLYLGAYLFEEPGTCRGAGMSDRNGYMLDLKATYRHFGLEPLGGELADFLPLVAEFLALSAARADLDRSGLRRRLLERFVAPALPSMRERLQRYESPYAGLIGFLSLLVADDVASAPAETGPAPAPGLELPVIQLPDRRTDPTATAGAAAEGESG